MGYRKLIKCVNAVRNKMCECSFTLYCDIYLLSGICTSDHSLHTVPHHQQKGEKEENSIEMEQPILDTNAGKQLS